jgi:Kdo2-lipid IVA lauroyltransferase/acyltransferase
MIAYLLYRLVSMIANIVPRPLGNWMSLRVADLNYYLNKVSRESVRANLKVILPDDSDEHRQYTLRWMFRAFGKYMFEFVGNKRCNAAFINRCVSIKGREHVDNALAKGRGVVLLGAHLGNWELGASALAYAGIPVLGVIQKHSNRRIHEFYMKQRQKRGYEVVVIGEAARKGLRHLKNNGALALLAERPFGEDGIEVDFFGRKAIFAGGPARIAVTRRTDMIPTFVLRRWDDSFGISFSSPITAPADLSKDEKIKFMTQEFANQLEVLIRENPTQWLTFYRVFEGTRRPEERGF